MKYLGVQWCEACKDRCSMMKHNLTHLAPPTNRKEAQHLVGLSGFWKQHIPHSGVLFWPIYQVTQKAVSFEWGSEQQKAMQLVQGAMQAALPLGPCDPADPVVSEVSVAGRDAVWSLWQAPIGELQQAFRILKQGSAVICRQLLSHWKTACGMLPGLSRKWTFEHGTPGYHARHELGIIWCTES